MLFARLRRSLKPLARTPLHPQWLVLRGQAATRAAVLSAARGLVLDIGCGDRWLSADIGTRAHYVGLDYPPTVAQGYAGAPEVFGDACDLPFGDACAELVLLLDVLEHLRAPEAALTEAVRVLKPGGRLVLQVPFLYPVHDAPNDYRRWTQDGLRLLLAQHGLAASEETVQGHPLETAASLMAIALAKAGLDTLTRRRLALPLLPLLVLAIPCTNLGGWLLARLLPADPFMPMGYRLIATKTA
ncbi:MAG TPA: class I SAM-dependent methyltransferase [Gammaproteobacteria bacterium]|jgi:SAM-dependent methyltransferase